MNRFLPLFVVVVISVGLAGCPSPSESEVGYGDGIGDVARLKTTSCSRSLHLSRIPVGSPGAALACASGARELTDDNSVKTVSFFDDGERNRPVVFVTSTGREVVLSVTLLKRITDTIIAVSYEAVIEVEVPESGDPEALARVPVHGKALVNVESGKVYDFDGYDIDNCFVENDVLFITRDWAGLFKIPLVDFGAVVPLNVPEYDPAGGIGFILNNRVIGSGTAFDVNGVIPPCSIKPVFVREGTMTGAGESFSGGVAVHDWNDGLLFDESGALWGYRFNAHLPLTKIGSYRLSIDDDGNTIVSDYGEVSLSYPLSGAGGAKAVFFLDASSGFMGDHVVVAATGYVRVQKRAGSGIEFANGSLSFGVDFPNQSVFREMNMYWNDIWHHKIMNMNLASNTLNELYSNANIVDTALRLSDDKLLFHQYITATEVGTYSLTIGETTPVLISTDRVDIESIVELDF